MNIRGHIVSDKTLREYELVALYQNDEVAGYVREQSDVWVLQAVDVDSRGSLFQGVIHLPKDKWPTKETAVAYLTKRLA